MLDKTIMDVNYKMNESFKERINKLHISLQNT